MSPATILDDAARQDVIRKVLADSRRVLADLGTLLDTGVEEEQVLAGLRRLLAGVERPSSPRSWHLARDPRPGDVPDVTTARWPRMCTERSGRFANPDGAAEEWTIYGCTRLIGHTGRHAGGDGHYIVAVWEQDVPELLGPVEGAS